MKRPRFFTRWLRRLATFIRGVAAAMERLSSNAAVDPVMEELAARYPGAPEHWLQHIAARMQNLKEEEFQTPEEGPDADGDRVSPDPGPQRTGQAPLRLTSAKRLRGPSIFNLANDSARSAAPELALARDRQETPRPHLRFLSYEEGRKRQWKHAAPSNVDSIDNAVAKRRRYTEGATIRQARNLKPHLLSSQDGPPKRNPSMTRTESDGESSSLLVRLRGVFTARTASAPRTPLGEPNRMSVRDNAAVDRPLSGSVPILPAGVKRWLSAVPAKKSPGVALGVVAGGSDASPRELLSSAQISPTRNALRFPAGPIHPANAKAEFPNESFGACWPELPPVRHTVPETYVEPPRLSQLRREQEEGLWSA